MSLFPTYNRFPVDVKSATGTIVEDIHGKTYIDFGSGIGVVNLGHGHPKIVSAVEKQLKNYWHVSNLYGIPIQETVAEKLVEHSAFDAVFFCNSGAEANEAAIKLARKYTGKNEIITFEKSFHGRTFATMAATGQDKVRIGYGDMLPTFKYATYNDLASVEAAVSNQTAGIMLEVVQGEGGVIPGDVAFIQGVEKICQAYDMPFIVDEIQTGMGRTGKKFAYEHYDIKPDIMTLAKGLGNGLPVGAMLAGEKYQSTFGPGAHGSTFGGNPIAMAAANAVMDIVFDPNFLGQVEANANYLAEKSQRELLNLDEVVEIRQKGLMVGIEIKSEALPYVLDALDQGLFILSAGESVLRLLPPLTATRSEMDQVLEILKRQLA